VEIEIIRISNSSAAAAVSEPIGCGSGTRHRQPMLRRQDVDSAPIEATQETKQKVLVPAFAGALVLIGESSRDIW